MKKVLVLTSVFFSLFLVMAAMQGHSQECRRIQPIASPVAADTPIVEGATKVREVRAIDRQVVEKTMQQIAESWNTPEMAKKLAAGFYDKDRLMDSMNANAPVDARLRFLSVGSYRVLRQEIKPEADGDRLISRVSVIAKSQIEYNDPVNGFQRRQGEQEYIVKITQREAAR